MSLRGARGKVNPRAPSVAIHSTFPIPFMSDDLHDQIKTLLVENLMLRVPKEQIGDEAPLFSPEGLGLDSIDALELVVSLEKKFGVTVPNAETAKRALATVQSIHDYVLANRKV